MKEITLTGLLTACDWDQQGKPILYKIGCRGENDFLVRAGDSKGNLQPLLRQWVKIKGTIQIVNNMKHINITSINPTKPGGLDEL